MRFLRTASTGRLLALLLGVVAVCAAGAAIALAATSGAGPKPPRKPLAQAIHDALTAPRLAGVTARVRFTDHLIDASAVTGSNPLLTGASGRLWASSDGRLRIELQSDNGDVQVVAGGGRFLIYDGSSNTAYSGEIPHARPGRHAHAHGGPPSLARIRRALARLSAHAGLSGAIPTDVAGRPAYQVRVTPKGPSGLVSGAQLAWDAIRGVPLRIGVYARGDSSPVLALTVSSISYGPVRASVFDITPPKGARVVDLTPRGGRGSAPPVRVSAPRRLAGERLHEVRRTGSGALITYGRGLDSIVVIERKARPETGATAPSGRSENGLQLPTVSIDGTTGQELPTALGTAVMFTRGGVDYTVLASKPAATVLAAARAL